MEALLSQFFFLSDQALQDKNFDPTSIEDLMKLFELEADNSWSALEADCNHEVKEAEASMREAEDYLDSVMEDAMDEFRRFEAELDHTVKAEHDSLVKVAKTAKKMGKTMQDAATTASKKYIEAAVKSATMSMKSARKGFPFNPNKVHPS